MYGAKVIRVLIASPGDTKEERKVASEAINDWNAIHSRELSCVLLPVKWEAHSTPRLGDRPQKIINDQIVKDSDILIGIFGTRVGSPTGKYESGTLEEIQEFLETGKPVMLYFSQKPVPPNLINTEQLTKLRKFKDEFKKKGLIDDFADDDDFNNKLSRHLQATTYDILKKIKQSPTSSSEKALKTIINPPAIVIQHSENLEKLKYEWDMERRSKPSETPGGYVIIGNLENLVSNLRYIMRDKLSTNKLNELDNLVIEIKELKNHQLYLDGGESVKEFWEKGEELLNKSKDAFKDIEKST